MRQKLSKVIAPLTPTELRLGFGLFISNGLSVALFLLRVIGTGNDRFNFMLWNLFLGWLPLLFSIYLVRRLKTTKWLTWTNGLLTFLWLGFLPNSFYLITDLIHLQSTGEINILFDTVMMLSFIFNGLVVGYISLYQMHNELAKRLSHRRTQTAVALVLLATSFAIYLGRSLRWNSWDILFNPAGLLFDVSDRLIHPISYPEAVLTTSTFFMLLTAMYVVVWQLVQMLNNPRKG